MKDEIQRLQEQLDIKYYQLARVSDRDVKKSTSIKEEIRDEIDRIAEEIGALVRDSKRIH